MLQVERLFHGSVIEKLTHRDLENRLLQSLGRRQMPDYFLYVGDGGAQNWLRLDHSPEFPIASRLTELLKANSTAIARDLPQNVGMVCVGVGDGLKERILLKHLPAAPGRSYLAVDVSFNLVRTAIRNVCDLPVKAVGIVALLEDLPQLRPYWSSPTLMCLLGNNFSNHEPDELLTMLNGQLTQEDFLLFDCHLCRANQSGQWQRQVERHYRAEENVLFNIAPLTSRGMRPEDCRFQIDLIEVETPFGTALRTRKTIEILNDVTLQLGSQRITLAAGETISMGFTYKFLKEQVEACLQRHGFMIISQFMCDSEDNLLVLAKKNVRGEDT